MTSSVRIRPAAVSDAPAMAAVHVETWRTTYAGLLPDRYLLRLSVPERAERWRVMLARRRSEQVFVAEINAVGVVGFASCGALRSGFYGYRGEVYTLYVLPDWQGRGLGRALLGVSFQDLFDRGISSAFLWVVAGSPNRFFYEAMGGKILAQRREPFAGMRLLQTAYGWRKLEHWLATHRSS